MSLLFFSCFEPRKQNSFTSLVFWRQQKSQRRMLLTLNKQKIVCKARYHYSKWEKPGEFAWTSYYSKSYKTKKVKGLDALTEIPRQRENINFQETESYWGRKTAERTEHQPNNWRKRWVRDRETETLSESRLRSLVRFNMFPVSDNNSAVCSSLWEAWEEERRSDTWDGRLLLSLRGKQQHPL